jgi:hypothetical protein
VNTDRRLLLLIVAMLALLLIFVSALPELVMDGRAVPRETPMRQVYLRPQKSDLYSFLILSFVTLVLVMLYLIRRRPGMMVLYGVIVMAVAFLLWSLIDHEPSFSTVLEPVVAIQTPNPTKEMELEKWLPPQPETRQSRPTVGWQTLTGGVGTALVLIAAVAGLGWYFWFRIQSPVEHTAPLQELALQAQSAVDALHRGGALHEVVIRCYYEMSHVLSENRDIQRREVMTTREFESILIAIGLPPEPIADLTRIFEEVRYGSREPNPDEVKLAVASLTAISKACREQL